ncbi:MAG: hypothetical protein ACOY0T_07335 [Myxococcota bacterium]
MDSYRVFRHFIPACFVLSCAQPPPLNGSKTPAASLAPTPDPFQATIDWNPDQISEPNGGWFRVKAPATVLPRLLLLSGDPSLRGFSDLRTLAGLTLGGQLASLIDFDAPIDLLVSSAEEQPWMVGAARVANADGFEPKKLGEALRPLSRGRWEIHPDDGGENLRCELWNVAPPVGYRVLCSKEQDEITRAAPFLLGRLAKEPLASDARLEIPRAMFAKHLKPQDQDATSTDPGARLGRSWIESLSEAQRLAVDVKLLEQDVELGIAFEYLADGKSPLLEAWLGEPNKEPLPAQFWPLLDQASIAFASAGTDPQTAKAAAGSSGTAAQIFEELTVSSGIPRELLARMTRELGDVFPHRYRFVFFQSGALPGLRSNSAKANAGNANSWMLLGLAGSGDRYKAGLNVLLEASKRAPVARGPSKNPPQARFVLVNKRFPDLPNESFIYRSETPTGTTYFTWVLPSADWVWLLSARSERQLLDQARALLPKLRDPVAPDKEQVALFGDKPPLLALSVSLAGWQNLDTKSLSKVDLTTLPFGGSARIFARANGERRQRESGATFSLELWSRWSPAAIADIVALIKLRAKAKRETASEH